MAPHFSAQRVSLIFGGLFVFFITFAFTFNDSLRNHVLPGRPHTSKSKSSSQLNSETKLHVLLPASRGAVDMCKTLLTGAILGYPTPTLIAWGGIFMEDNTLGGGSHIAKISGVKDYLDAMDPSTDDDLILMMDAYDIWLQLPPEVLISRYYSMNAKANKRLATKLGQAYDKEDIRQTIIFAAGKRCAPNKLHTIACYPIPDSPLPDDTYGSNTDTVMGRNKYTSLKQRYLNSGYIIGPRRDLRKLFHRAAEKVESTPALDPWDNGSGEANNMYRGSDQSIFSTILGEQEYQREVLRRRHLTKEERLLGKEKPTPHQIEGTIIADPLNPPYTHEPGESKKGRPDEYGIGLDYFSDMGLQTVNAEEDMEFLLYNTSITEQVQQRQHHFHGIFDCPNRIGQDLAGDILESQPPQTALTGSGHWNELPLASNLCTGTVPVMIHHNGDKNARAWQWPMTWMQPLARELMRDIVSKNPPVPGLKGIGGAYLPGGGYLDWQTLCPSNYEYELFRDVEPPEEAPPPA
ncbi:uncharacterized protein RCC_08949 [Ramularia collo-cygni]|uniref:Uncharacterized protein n=1 Tax=Ramularia collo-cygni TaxID=112498 RepID=A0A2D3VNC8_9PEZI|nr:uncharacterized protein RCC_08949 [Ramularia collo-cygni]CZT23238.1 uncharacterized protein RCC_08949 [Ramularia collo-cygni]